MEPTIGSPGTGRQHFARRIMTSSIPSTEIPKRDEVVVARERRRRVFSRSSAAVGSDSAASPCLRRCITLLTIILGEIFAAPSAM